MLAGVFSFLFFFLLLFPIWRSMTDLQLFCGSEKCCLWTESAVDALKPALPQRWHGVDQHPQDPDTSGGAVAGASRAFPTCSCGAVWMPSLCQGISERGGHGGGCSGCLQNKPQPHHNQDQCRHTRTLLS